MPPSKSRPKAISEPLHIVLRPGSGALLINVLSDQPRLSPRALTAIRDALQAYPASDVIIHIHREKFSWLASMREARNAQ